VTHTDEDRESVNAIGRFEDLAEPVRCPHCSQPLKAAWWLKLFHERGTLSGARMTCCAHELALDEARSLAGALGRYRVQASDGRPG
jgi:hypothetical protein